MDYKHNCKSWKPRNVQIGWNAEHSKELQELRVAVLGVLFFDGSSEGT